MARPWWLPSDRGEPGDREVRWPQGQDPRVIAAETLDEAMAAARDRYGAQVRFVAARSVARGLKGLLGHEVVEVLVEPGPSGPAGAGADADGYTSATLEELLELADGADDVGLATSYPPDSPGQPDTWHFDRAHRSRQRATDDPFEPHDLGGAADRGDRFGAARPTPPPLDAVSFDALVREALDRVPSRPTRVPGRPSQLRHPAPEVVVDPVAPPRLRPTPVRRAAIALGPGPGAIERRAPRWSSRALTALGLPRTVVDALPPRPATDDAGWTGALTEVLRGLIDDARTAAGPEPAATVSGRGGQGALAIVNALALGAVPDELDDGNGMRPASPESIAGAIRGLL